jgi:hypothetical protein
MLRLYGSSSENCTIGLVNAVYSLIKNTDNLVIPSVIRSNWARVHKQICSPLYHPATSLFLDILFSVSAARDPLA